MKKPWLFSILFFFVALIVDQATKFIAFSKIPSQGIFLLNSFLQIQLLPMQNKLGAFSFDIAQTFLIALIVLILAILSYTVYRLLHGNKKPEALAVSLIIGAALSNLLDRIFNNGVRDFIALSFFGKAYPIFNIADIFISLGTLWLIVLILKKPRATNKSTSNL